MADRYKSNGSIDILFDEESFMKNYMSQSNPNSKTLDTSEHDVQQVEKYCSSQNTAFSINNINDVIQENNDITFDVDDDIIIN